MERNTFLGNLVSVPLTDFFAPNEVKKPYKDTLRMYMTLYPKDNPWEENEEDI